MRSAHSVGHQLIQRLKQVGYVAAMVGALRDRGVSESTASVAAELGALAFKQAYATWTEADENQDLAKLSLVALHRLRATVAELG